MDCETAPYTTVFLCTPLINSPAMAVCDETGDLGRRCRRLRFLELDPITNQYISRHIQTEMALIDGSVSARPLMTPYCRIMIACLSLCPRLDRVLVLGNGGGALSSFISSAWPETQVVAVERDTRIASLARKFFKAGDFGVDVVIKDAIDYVVDADSGSFNVVIVDVNAESGAPIDAPAPAFLQETTLAQLSRILDDDGVVLIDVLLPEHTSLLDRGLLYKETEDNIRMIFASVHVCSWTPSENVIMCCSANPLPSRDDFKTNFSNWLLKQSTDVQEELQNCKLDLEWR